MPTAEHAADASPAVLSYERASKLFNLYRFVSRLGFHVPLVTLAFIELPLILVGLLVATYGLASSFSAPIAKGLARRLGLGRTLALGEAGKAFGALGIGVLVAGPDLDLTTFAMIAAACQVVGGIGYTVAAIPDGMLAGTLRTLPDAPDNTSEADARAASFMFAAFMFAGVMGAAIAQFAFHIPFFMGGAASLCATVAALGLIRLDTPQPQPSTPRHTVATPGPVPTTAKDAMLVYGLYRGASLSIQVGIMPILLFLDRQVPIWLIGVAFASYTFTGFLSAKRYGAFSKRLGDRAQAVAIGLLSVLSLVGLALIPGMWVAIAPVPLFFAAGLVRPYCLPRLTADLSEPAAKQARIASAERLFALVSAGSTFAAFALLSFGVALPIFFGGAACVLALSALMLAVRA
mmetsp:Transcript_29505/g.57909  ORF Transcript_29505/g.57909 Transcript_29505/m.57909 type:complete len:405 (-) Transcript_29505:867-2081(-)